MSRAYDGHQTITKANTALRISGPKAAVIAIAREAGAYLLGINGTIWAVTAHEDLH